MEGQVPPSQMPIPGQITPDQLADLKAKAREMAIQQALQQQQQQQQQQPKVVYVRRNLTVAELLLVLLVACGLVAGVQGAWNLATNVLPRIEVKVK